MYSKVLRVRGNFRTWIPRLLLYPTYAVLVLGRVAIEVGLGPSRWSRSRPGGPRPLRIPGTFERWYVLGSRVPARRR